MSAKRPGSSSSCSGVPRSSRFTSGFIEDSYLKARPGRPGGIRWRTSAQVLNPLAPLTSIRETAEVDKCRRKVDRGELEEVGESQDPTPAPTTAKGLQPFLEGPWRRWNGFFIAHRPQKAAIIGKVGAIKGHLTKDQNPPCLAPDARLDSRGKCPPRVR